MFVACVHDPEMTLVLVVITVIQAYCFSFFLKNNKGKTWVANSRLQICNHFRFQIKNGLQMIGKSFFFLNTKESFGKSLWLRWLELLTAINPFFIAYLSFAVFLHFHTSTHLQNIFFLVSLTGIISSKNCLEVRRRETGSHLLYEIWMFYIYMWVSHI
jgi:hypothetical protein